MHYITHWWHNILYQLAQARPHNVVHFLVIALSWSYKVVWYLWMLSDYQIIHSVIFWLCYFYYNIRALNILLLWINLFTMLRVIVNWPDTTTCTRGFILQSDWYRQSKVQELDNFFPRCYLLLLFVRREPGNKANSYIPCIHAHCKTFLMSNVIYAQSA